MTQENMIIQPINVICNEQHLVIPHKFANATQILLFWNTNKLKIENKNIGNNIQQRKNNAFIELKKI